MKKIVLTGVVALLFVLGSCNQGGSEDQVDENISINEEQPLSSEHDIKPEYLTTATFKEKIWDYESNPEKWTYKGDLPCIVDFYADWCKPCKMVAPIMDDLADYYDGKVKIYKVNTDENRELATVFQVRSIPAILFAPIDGKPAMQPGAMTKEDYIKIIDEFVLKSQKQDNEQTQS